HRNQNRLLAVGIRYQGPRVTVQVLIEIVDHHRNQQPVDERQMAVCVLRQGLAAEIARLDDQVLFIVNLLLEASRLADDVEIHRGTERRPGDFLRANVNDLLKVLADPEYLSERQDTGDQEIEE